jgi:hypothetical protein
MNKKFLHRVVDQILSESKITVIDHSLILSSFFLTTPLQFPFPHFNNSVMYSQFSKHCKTVYSLKYFEVEYVWEEYKSVIEDKINKELLWIRYS